MQRRAWFYDDYPQQMAETEAVRGANAAVANNYPYQSSFKAFSRTAPAIMIAPIPTLANGNKFK